MPLIRERLEWPFKAGITCLLPFARKREKWARWQDLWGGERGAWTGPAEKVLGAAGRSLELEGFEDERSVALKRDRMGPWWLEQWLGVPVISLGTWKGDAYLIRRRGTLLTACGEVLWKDAAAGWNGCSALEQVWKERFGMIFRRGGLGGGVLAGQGSGRYGLLQVRGAVLRWVLTQDREEANQWMQRGTLAPGGGEAVNALGIRKLTIPDIEDNTITEGT